MANINKDLHEPKVRLESPVPQMYVSEKQLEKFHGPQGIGTHTHLAANIV